MGWVYEGREENIGTSYKYNLPSVNSAFRHWVQDSHGTKREGSICLDLEIHAKGYSYLFTVKYPSRKFSDQIIGNSAQDKVLTAKIISSSRKKREVVEKRWLVVLT